MGLSWVVLSENGLAWIGLKIYNPLPFRPLIYLLCTKLNFTMQSLKHILKDAIPRAVLVLTIPYVPIVLMVITCRLPINVQVRN